VTLGFGDVRAWRAAPLGIAGDGVKRDADDLEGCREQLASQGLPDSWVGVARMVAQARLAGMLSSMDTWVEGRRQVQRALYLAETDVEAIERSVTAVEEAAASARFALGDDGSITDLMGPQTFPNRFEAEEWSRARAATMQRLAVDVEAILVQAVGVDAALARSITGGDVDDIDDYATPMERAGIDQALACAVVGSPETVRRGLAAFIERTGADELIIAGHIYDHAARLRSYEIAASVRAALAQLSR